MEKKKIKVKELQPGDPVIFPNNKILFIKNIYQGNNSVSSIVVKIHGNCVILEYTDDLDKCNKNYTVPELKSINNLDHSCVTPSI